MKSLFLGILFIIIIGFGGLVYRNAVEHSNRPIVCPMDSLVCPDGTSVARTGMSCTFAMCPPPNVTLADIGISFAVPDGFVTSLLPDTASVVAYELSTTSSTSPARIIVRRFKIDEQATALATIQQTAVGITSGVPVSPALFSSTVLGTHRFTVVTVDRFEGNVDTAFYLARGTDVLRFDAIDSSADWTNSNLDIYVLPAHSALKELLVTLQGK